MIMFEVSEAHREYVATESVTEIMTVRRKRVFTFKVVIASVTN